MFFDVITFDLISLFYSILMLSLVPVIVIISDKIIALLRPNEKHNRLNVLQMILYISLLIIGLLIIYTGIENNILDKNIRTITLTLIGPLVTISSNHLNDSIKQFL